MSGLVVLTGGVGGAKLVHGVMLAAPDKKLTVIVNTGDDFRHLGLHVSPDIDTVLYTLSGRANRAQGWGREDESWSFMEAVRSLGGVDWFNLGDGDLALHVLRTARLSAGECLGTITQDFADAWKINARILPMSEGRVTTMLDSDAGSLQFQRYFVQLQCVPKVHRIWFESDAAKPAPGVIAAISQAEVVLIAPSNPYLSIDPILSVQGVADALRATAAPVVAVSPLIAGKSVKGPTAKLMAEFGTSVDNSSIGMHYSGLIDGLLIDAKDAAPTGDLAIARSDIMMRNEEDRVRVANAALNLALELAHR
jgi:LPPG:FO 2-phospho-L-lactate transferase